jgi:fucose 4-O-acetylase-like acetyltransferase
MKWVLIAKGIGITLVVVGHFFPPQHPAYWTAVRDVIYAFHMPLFFVLSGFLYSHGKYAYGDLVLNKVRRLLYPFATIAVIFLLLKVAADQVASLSHPVDARSVYMLLVDPVRSYMPLLWFMHALFIIFIVYPPLRTVLRSNLAILLLAVALNALVQRRVPVVAAAIIHLPYFVLGVMMREHQQRILQAIDRWPLGAVVVPGIVFAAAWMVGEDAAAWARDVRASVLAISGSLAIIGMSRALEQSALTRFAQVVAVVGFYSMSIYLLHPLFESPVRIVFLQWLRGLAVPFELVAALAIAAGVVLPLLLEKHVLRNVEFTRRYVLGLEASARREARASEV